MTAREIAERWTEAATNGTVADDLESEIEAYAEEKCQAAREENAELKREREREREREKMTAKQIEAVADNAVHQRIVLSPMMRIAELETQLQAAREENERLQLELELFQSTLNGHWVTAVECDHENKTDTVRCSCSIWTGTPQRSVGMAISEWVEHVLAVVRARVALNRPAAVPAVEK